MASINTLKQTAALMHGMHYNREKGIFMCPSCGEGDYQIGKLTNGKHPFRCADLKLQTECDQLAANKGKGHFIVFGSLPGFYFETKTHVSDSKSGITKVEPCIDMKKEQTKMHVTLDAITASFKEQAKKDEEMVKRAYMSYERMCRTQQTLSVEEQWPEKDMDVVDIINPMLEEARMVGALTEEVKIPLPKRKKQKRALPRMNWVVLDDIGSFVESVISQAINDGKVCEFIRKGRKVAVEGVQIGHKRIHTIKHSLRHVDSTQGPFNNDMHTDAEATVIYRTVQHVLKGWGLKANEKLISSGEITAGSSGTVLHKSWLIDPQNFECCDDEDFIVVKGRDLRNNKIMNALVEHSVEEMHFMHLYSNLELNKLFLEDDQQHEDNEVNVVSSTQVVTMSDNVFVSSYARGHLGSHDIGPKVHFGGEKFEWGLRAEEIKKFFAKYYEESDRDSIPTWARVRAVGAAIRQTHVAADRLVLNATSMREARTGVQRRQPTRTQDCTTAMNGWYCEGLCCLTNAKGAAVESKIVLPHLYHMAFAEDDSIIYLKTPGQGDKIVYPKEGYCYLQIFLNMYAVLDEVEARNFTRYLFDKFIPSLGQWPLFEDVVNVVMMVANIFPCINHAPLPLILIDHITSTMHVVDHLGSKTYGYHMLAARVVNELTMGGTAGWISGIKRYRVGGLKDQITRTVQIIVDEEKLMREMTQDPKFIFYAMASTTILKVLHKGGALNSVLRYCLEKEDNLVDMVNKLNYLGEKVSRCSNLETEIDIWTDHVNRVIEACELFLNENRHNTLSVYVTQAKMQLEALQIDRNIELAGHVSIQKELFKKKEELLTEELRKFLTEPKSWFGPLYLDGGSKRCLGYLAYEGQHDTTPSQHTVKNLVGDWFAKGKAIAKRRKEWAKDKLHQMYLQTSGAIVYTVIKNTWRKSFSWFNAINMYSGIITIINIGIMVQGARKRYLDNKAYHLRLEMDAIARELEEVCKNKCNYEQLCEKAKDEVDAKIITGYTLQNEELIQLYRRKSQQLVQFQTKKENERVMKAFAFVTLIVMLFDACRADMLYKSFNMVQSLTRSLYTGSAENGINFQNSDNIERNIDIVLADPTTSYKPDQRTTFSEWVRKNILSGHVKHITPDGVLMDFTRQNAAEVAQSIIASDHKEILVRGFVGSGKSTNLPHLLSRVGKVLVCEPVRVLASNVCKSLASEPFHQSATLKMRGIFKAGSGPITVTTAGYAFAYYQHNMAELNTYEFVILDECHIQSDDVLTLRSLLDTYNYKGKIIHVSATPIGKEIPFKTMYPVEVVNTGDVSIDDFAKQQGTGTKIDVSVKGPNILVYVASFSEVDRLSKILADKGFKVLKIDSRTIQYTQDIKCDGTDASPLYIVATNIVENGVTLNVDAVVDFGKQVVPALDTANRTLRFEKCRISYGQRIQRNGRVGRFKSGYCLNFGDVVKHNPTVNSAVTTAAALKCFAANTKPFIEDVDTSIFKSVTAAQMKTANSFEVNTYITLFLVNADGEVHNKIYPFLKRWVLRDSEIKLTKSAAHMGKTANWNLISDHIENVKDDVALAHARIPFYTHEFGEKNYKQLAYLVLQSQKESCNTFNLQVEDPAEVALILQTDKSSLPRSIFIVEEQLKAEREKLAQLTHVASNTASLGSRAASWLLTMVPRRYKESAIVSNIEKLEQARNQLMSYNQAVHGLKDEELYDYVKDNADISMVINFQSGQVEKQMEQLGIKGRYDYTRLASDAVGLLMIGLGILLTLFMFVWYDVKDEVNFEGKRDRLRMRDKKMDILGYTMDGPDKELKEAFGAAYERKNKGKRMKEFAKEKGKTNIGVKLDPFRTFYSVDVEDFDALYAIDPKTGVEVKMDNVYADGNAMEQEIDFSAPMTSKWGDHDLELIKAKFVKHGLNEEVIKSLIIDLTRHQPTQVTSNGGIMGYPEKRGVFRQTGQPKVSFESRSEVLGEVDVAPFKGHICTIEVVHEGDEKHYFENGLFHIGSKAITNAHVFKKKVKEMVVNTQHGRFENLSGHYPVTPLKGFDFVVVHLPKDIPPTKKIKNLRKPKAGEKVRILKGKVNKFGELCKMQVTDVGHVTPGNSSAWKHNISTVNGDCASPLIAVKDNFIVGFHTGNVIGETTNIFTPVTDQMIALLNSTEQNKEYEWVWDMGDFNFNYLSFPSVQPSQPFFPVQNIVNSLLNFQHGRKRLWVGDEIPDNMLKVGYLQTYFNTRHTVEGLNKWFQEYLNQNETAMEFFKPLVNKYQPSNLNGEAYKKDFYKYAKPTRVGDVDFDMIAAAGMRVADKLKRAGFEEKSIRYQFDPVEIYCDMNHKAAMGAQYKGKKKEYLDDVEVHKFTQEVEHAIFRLAEGKPGTWKGSLKAELRLNEKVQQNKTRVFTAAPYDTLLGAKVCVDSFNKKFYETNCRGPWTVGINKFCRGWHDLLQTLPKGWIYGTGDGSQFDSSLTPLLLHEVCKMRLKFMEANTVGEKCIKNLYKQIIWTPVSSPDGSVILKKKGNNSGQPSTVVDNTIMVMLAVEYAIASYKRDSGVDCTEGFMYYCNGDDIMFAVQPEKESFLDNISQYFKQLGLNYIFEDRTTNKCELEYMSLTPLVVDGVYVPKLSRERIVAIVQWKRRGDEDAVFDALNAAIIESWGYDDLTQELRKYMLWLIQNGYGEGLKPIMYHTDQAIRNLYLLKNDEEHAALDISNWAVDVVYKTFDIAFQAGGPTIKEDDDELGKRVGDDPSEIAPGNSSTEGEAFAEIELPKVKLDKMSFMPKYKGKPVISAVQLHGYRPNNNQISLNIASQAQHEKWLDQIKEGLEMEDISAVMMGWLAWCINNGTSESILDAGSWRMAKSDGTEVELPTEPFRMQGVELRKMMRLYSSAAIDHIMARRNRDPNWKPRLAAKRNLRSTTYYNYAFDFLDETTLSKEALEVVHQMKAAALQGKESRVLGLDGNQGTSVNTERHTVQDATRNTHNMGGAAIGV